MIVDLCELLKNSEYIQRDVNNNVVFIQCPMEIIKNKRLRDGLSFPIPQDEFMEVYYGYDDFSLTTHINGRIRMLTIQFRIQGMTGKSFDEYKAIYDYYQAQII